MTGFPDDYWTRAEDLRGMARGYETVDDPLDMARGVLVGLAIGGAFLFGMFVEWAVFVR